MLQIQVRFERAKQRAKQNNFCFVLLLDNDDSINDSDRYTKRASAADYLHKDLLSDTNLMEKAAENNHHVNNNHVTFKSSMYYPADVESCTKYNPKIDYFDKTDKQGNYQNKISQM